MSDSQSPSSKPKRSRNYKIVILGDGGVGKSALTMQFVCHRFLDYHDPTIEDAYQKQANIDGEPAMLDILDTAGQPEFTAMRDQYMRNGEGFMLCYSVIDRRSFNAVLENKNLVERVRNREDIPLVLVGNKCDLRSKRVIPIDEGQEMARKLGCPFFETSAALRHYVDDAFHGMVREIRKREREIQVAEVKRQKEKNRRQRLANFLHHLNITRSSKHNSP